MNKSSLSIFLLFFMMVQALHAQNKMTPELLWELGRVSSQVVTPDGKVIYSVTRYDMKKNKGKSTLYSINIDGTDNRILTDSIHSASDFNMQADGKIGLTHKGQFWKINTDGNGIKEMTDEKDKMDHIRISPDGKHILFSKQVKLEKVSGEDFYPDMKKSSAQIYTDLMYRHWDQWFDGNFNHVFYADYDNGKISNVVDIMKDEPYNSPQDPFGGAEDFTWSSDGRQILYVSKKKTGAQNAISTNTDIYSYDLSTGITKNLTEANSGYDTNPVFSKDGKRMAWTSMKTDGYESDKNDIRVMDWANGYQLNLTGGWDGTVSSFQWSDDGKTIYFVAPVKGTIQLFSVNVPANLMVKMMPVVKQLTDGDFDIAGISGQHKDLLVLTRMDMNHAAELFSFNTKTSALNTITAVNKSVYDDLRMGKIEKRWVKTTDGKQELVWVIYPPDFNPTKKYPTLLYCQGGPQSEVSQFYSFRWNFQLMAANGYIIVAPNRRGLPGFGVQWNEEISGDWGGQPMKDYLSAIDELAKETYVDKNRLGAIGASYGGYSVYELAGIHNKRFKTFIAHDGLFDLRSWYGTTEELWFANHDIGGNYWDKSNKVAQNSYDNYSPSDHVSAWDTPIMIVQGGIDYRVPIEQGLQAFQAARLKGIKSKLLYFPDENHWVLKPQNGIVWQREFFKWLEETM